MVQTQGESGTEKADSAAQQSIFRRSGRRPGGPGADGGEQALRPAVHHLLGRPGSPGILPPDHGYVKLVKSSPDGKEYILRLVGPGETFAEAAVFGDAPYPASAVTLEDCQTLFFPKAPFLRHLAASPNLARNMLATLSHLNLHLTRQLEDLSLKEVSARLARYILERCQEAHGKIEAGLAFELPTTKTHLAAYLGTISETLSRTLSRFKSEGAIEVDKGWITILDPGMLKKMARGSKM